MEGDVLISRPLSPREALGDPGRDDLPILRGKEVLMSGVFRAATGRHSHQRLEASRELWAMCSICLWKGASSALF